MFKVICQTVGIVGCWAAMAWVSLFILSTLGVEVESSNETGIITVAVVVFVTSVTMEVRDWCRFNRLVVEKKR